MRARDIMTANPVIVNEQATVAEAADLVAARWSGS